MKKPGRASGRGRARGRRAARAPCSARRRTPRAAGAGRGQRDSRERRHACVDPADELPGRRRRDRAHVDGAHAGARDRAASRSSDRGVGQTEDVERKEDHAADDRVPPRLGDACERLRWADRPLSWWSRRGLTTAAPRCSRSAGLRGACPPFGVAGTVVVGSVLAIVRRAEPLAGIEDLVPHAAPRVAAATRTTMNAHRQVWRSPATC